MMTENTKAWDAPRFLGGDGVEVEKVGTTELLPDPSYREPSTMGMLQTLISRGADLEIVRAVMDLRDREEATQARKAYVRAMAAAKQKTPEIFKNRHVNFVTKAGVKVEYDHASLDHIVEVANEWLSPYGFSFGWDPVQTDKGITVTCKMTHEDGHSESATLPGPVDTSGTKNALQALGSTITYLQRYTFLPLVGLAAKSQDDDGKAGGALETITEKQAADLKSFILEVGVNMERILKYYKIENLSDLPANKYKQAIAKLETKRKMPPEVVPQAPAPKGGTDGPPGS